ncbi:beta-ketoacyl-ACP synthase [Shewanella intestini]|uniref:Beta-ketoacyl-ACP synthase n=2 Tax=Shewanellaceae TaxID=267890 RepID=A0ABS5I3R0_9GAMM|nr:beta-ketoacyl-ACP synthase [Shewanella intestini]MRG35789.1 beta-ketoacyl-ACP synthase [Shewanella sp. XMDDZSB0408]
MTATFIHAIGAISALGCGKQATMANLQQGQSPGLTVYDKALYSGRSTYVGKVIDPLVNLPQALEDASNRNNLIAATAYEQIKPVVEQYKQTIAANRIGVIIGTSTTAIVEGEKSIKHMHQHGQLPDDFRFEHQDIADPALFIARLAQVSGITYSLSTACSSSNRAFISAQSLLDADLCDVVICGGVDSLCDLTVNGFDSLEQVAASPSRPFDQHRSGINIGEAAALFVLSRAPSAIKLTGWGESGEGHHISAPIPCGTGAKQAMEQALSRANIVPTDIGYINAHGTATQLNDAMESIAIAELFGSQVPVSSTKALTGHCLGAAGAIEAAICCWALQQQQLPPQWPQDFTAADNVSALNFSANKGQLLTPRVLSNSFAFGGNNASLVFELHEQ